MMAAQGLVIEKVAPGSIAAELGVEPGDRLVAVNNQPVEDILDYRFLTCEEELTLTLLKAGGEKWLCDVEKDFDDDLGLEFVDGGLGPIRRCQNRCLFCFVDQMPPGLRPTLYVKDDDYRLSFLHGNFITLTGLKERDLERIIRLRLSPLYISVHTTNPALRVKMLGHPRAGEIMEQLRRLGQGGIEMHTQVVLCPGINDGRELERTVGDLINLWPAVRSAAIVPVGLTRYREGLTPLRTFNREEAVEVVERVQSWQDHCLERFARAMVYASDEFYLLAGREIPSGLRYDDFPQTENGVGLVRLFLDEWERVSRSLPPSLPSSRRLTVVTGVLAESILAPVVERLNKVNNLVVNLAVVPSGLFGPSVTVAGLISGKDIVTALEGRDRGQALILPAVMVRQPEQVFLDGMTVQELSARLDCPVFVVDGPAGLVEVCLNYH
jgi:putative radical SAM enzyme (TIGR03279 family)